MQQQSSTFSGLAKTTTCLLGLTLLAACGADATTESMGSVGTQQHAITSEWMEIELINGWENYYPNLPAAVGLVNDTVVFRGALRGENATDPLAFILDEASYGPVVPDLMNAMELRTVMRTGGANPTNVGGQLSFDPINPQPDGVPRVYIYQDDTPHDAIGDAARNFVSLDGVSFDRHTGDPLPQEEAWEGRYGHRIGLSGCSDCGAYVTLADGFVRFQGALVNEDNLDTFLFTIPYPEYIPSQPVTMVANIGEPNNDSSIGQSPGVLVVYPSGDVWVYPNPLASASLTSFEGVSFGLNTTGQAFPLNSAAGWQSYFGSRPAKVGNYDGIVRFEGAVRNGNSPLLGTLPPGMRPAEPVRVPAVAYVGNQATLLIDTDGTVRVEGPPQWVSTLFISLDGVSFAAADDGNNAAGELLTDYSLITSWPTGYCARIHLTNPEAEATTSWQATVSAGSATVTQYWTPHTPASSPSVSLASESWNEVISGGGSFNNSGFCASHAPGAFEPPQIDATAQY